MDVSCLAHVLKIGYCTLKKKKRFLAFLIMSEGQAILQPYSHMATLPWSWVVIAHFRQDMPLKFATITTTPSYSPRALYLLILPTCPYRHLRWELLVLQILRLDQIDVVSFSVIGYLKRKRLASFWSLWLNFMDVNFGRTWSRGPCLLPENGITINATG